MPPLGGLTGGVVVFAGGAAVAGVATGGVAAGGVGGARGGKSDASTQRFSCVHAAGAVHADVQALAISRVGGGSFGSRMCRPPYSYVSLRTHRSTARQT